MTTGPTPPTPPGVAGMISYVGPPPVSRRVLDLDLRRSLVAKGYQPTVSIDGQRYVCGWGSCRFEVPAERAAHVSVHIEHRSRLVGAAALLLEPSQAPQLEYSAPAHLSRPGSIGTVGSTSAQGRRTMGCLLAGLGISLLGLVLFVTLIVVVSVT